MNLSKIFLLKFFIILLSINVYPQASKEIYRSNSNGLRLVKINPSQMPDYKYILYVYYTDRSTDIINKKILYENNKEIKKWFYYYSDNHLTLDKYYKDNEIKESNRYENNGHKIKQEDYKNKKMIRITTYQYNNEGLVDIEKVFNLLNNQTTLIKYRYDTNFRIKQIEKKYPDGRLVFWESFFTDKGIIQREFYTLADERFTFWYNENGQEIKGEVKQIIDEKNDKIKKEWIVKYSKSGKKELKEESNYIIGKKTKTWYNANYKETRIETYKNNEIQQIELYEYNKDNKVTYSEIIKDLSSTKTLFKYDDKNNLTSLNQYDNDILKKQVIYNIDKSRTEILYGKNNKRIMTDYDSAGNLISQKIF